MTGQAGRRDYDFTTRVGTAAPGEPYFVIRGSDVVAGEVIRVWAALAAERGTPPEALELALQQADAIERWPVKKVPDGPDLSENERKQLRYEHGRRAWNARAQVASEYPMLAEKLATDAIAGKLRPLLAELRGLLPTELEEAARADPRHPLNGLFAMAGWKMHE
jgi:hypothetical protein